jgi:tripartite-type tricarboxylate transporter receptor subunit TctC
MSAPAQLMKALRDQRGAQGLRELRWVLSEARSLSVRRRVAKQVAGSIGTARTTHWSGSKRSQSSTARGKVMRSKIWLALATLATCFVLTAVAKAQSWPAKPLRAFIPFAAGSATDLVPRAVFEPLALELGQPIVVENRGGAGGTIAGNAVVRAEPDGYTILAGGTALTIAPWIVPNMPYDTAKDLAGALMIGQSADVLIVPPARGWKTVQDLVRAAKAKPGSINYSSAGVGTGTHLNAEKFRLSAGFEAVHIPYKGGAEALADVISGRVDFYFCPISTALPFIMDGRVVALAVSTPARASALPNLPTTLEAGYANSDLAVWYGVLMPAKTPRAIIDKFHAAGTKVLATPAMREKLKQLAVDPMPLAPAEIDKFVAGEVAANGRLIKAAGIQ